MDEAALLQAVLATPHDDAPRLVYADWLEERGDARAEYLRLQCQLVRSWSYDNQRADLFQKAAALRSQIDPGWLGLIRRCTTPRAPIDVDKVIPTLRKKARTAVRLHPRRGLAARDASKIGGLLLWPSAERWPECKQHRCPFVSALQLRKQDVRELGFRKGTDLFQVLWCPNDHRPQYAPSLMVFWRKTPSVTDPLDSHPGSSRPEEMDPSLGRYIPQPCCLYPERVAEYPPFPEITGTERQIIEESAEIRQALKLAQKASAGGYGSPEVPMDLYATWLSTSDGTKVGGYPFWVQDANYPRCSCKSPMEYLWTFSSWEYDGGNWGRWLAIEDRDVVVGRRKRKEVLHPDWMFGDAGQVYVFICRKCKHWPIQWFMQCS